MKLGLAAIDAVCARLGRPQEKFASVLIGGTNGKGSAAATLSAIARASGVAAGLYTSPHLIRVTERIRIEEEDVSSEELDAFLEEVFRAADAAPEIPVTYFEAMTAAAFSLFARRNLPLAILEVGLGGRFDATNIAPASVSVVTSVSLDHVEELGGSLASIAREKAGIFRAGRPALVYTREKEALDTLLACAGEAGASLYDVAGETCASGVRTGIEGTRFRLETPAAQYELFTPLPGLHQAANTACAVRAAEFLTGFPNVTRDSIAEGVASTRWPGRLEGFSIEGRLVLLDGCHNGGAALALARSLETLGLFGRTDLVFGAMADKDIESIAAALFPAARRVTLVAAPGARAATAGELLRRVGHLHPAAVAVERLEAAFERLLSIPATDPIIVAGSLYLVGEARALLLARWSEPTTHQREASVP